MSQSSRGVLNIRFNQTRDCFACAMEGGFRIYNVNPLAEKTRQDFEEVGGVSHVEMLYRTNLLAIVGGGRYPKYSERNVMIWDDSKKKMIFEISFHSPVLSVRLRKDKMIVVLYDEIKIFKFPSDIVLQRTLQTCPNPKGLCEVSYSVDKPLLLYPGHPQSGKLQVFDMTALDDASSANRSSSNRVIDAHKTEIVCIAVNQVGTKVATASAKGTLIRVHPIKGDTSDRIELRRGTDPAVIQCINFSPDSSFLCASSDKGTVHLFALRDLDLNNKSKLATVGLFGAYTESMWCAAQFSISNKSPCLCSFTPSNSIVAICMDGSFYHYTFKAEPGQANNCIRDSFDIFLDIGNDGI